jgi:hypothetical protein
MPLGEVLTGETVAQVVTSNHPAYTEGDIVLAPTGWRTHALSDGTGSRKLEPSALHARTRPVVFCRVFDPPPASWAGAFGASGHGLCDLAEFSRDPCRHMARSLIREVPREIPA